MLKCKKNQILRPIVPGSGEGGNQPTLFAPIITVNGNTVTWERDSRNGGFGDVVSGSIDGNAVSTPLYLNSSLDKKTLVVTSTSLHFNDASSNTQLSYISVQPVTKKCVVQIDALNPIYDTTYPEYTQLVIAVNLNIPVPEIAGWGNENWSKIGRHMGLHYNGTTLPYDLMIENHANAYSTYQIETRTGRQEIDLYFEVLEDFEFPQDTGKEITVTFSLYRYNPNGNAGSRERNGISKGNTYGFLDDEPSGRSYFSTPDRIESNKVIFTITGKKGIYTAYFDSRLS